MRAYNYKVSLKIFTREHKFAVSLLPFKYWQRETRKYNFEYPVKKTRKLVMKLEGERTKDLTREATP